MTVPRTPVVLVALALAAGILASSAAAAPIHVLSPDGRETVRQDPNLPPPDPMPATGRPAGRPTASARAARAKRSVGTELRRLLDAGSLAPDAYGQALTTWSDARSSLRRLTGRRAVELRAVMDSVQSLAAAGRLTAGRVPVLFEIVARNREWWTTGSLLSYGERVKFTGSRIVWQSYPGNGIQPQWLGTFGDANALAKSRRRSSATALGQLLDEAVALASPRAGGIAWESFFAFSGASPVWVSALSQGTGIQALARASQKLGRPDLLDAATRALGVFETPAPEGVALRTAAGTHYLIYSTNPHELVLNGFLQSLVGLYDYTQISLNPEGLKLFAAGDAEAQREVPRYDTGSWSLYDGRQESTLGYHQLVQGFLANLCDRTQTAVYCETASAFAQDETQPPALRVRTARASAGRSVPVTFTLSKISRVTLWVDGVPIDAATVGRGTHQLTWAGRRKPGAVTVRLTATDLAGNRGSVEKVVTLVRAKRT